MLLVGLYLWYLHLFQLHNVCYLNFVLYLFYILSSIIKTFIILNLKSFCKHYKQSYPMCDLPCYIPVISLLADVLIRQGIQHQTNEWPVELMSWLHGPLIIQSLSRKILPNSPSNPWSSSPVMTCLILAALPNIVHLPSHDISSPFCL